MDVTTPAAMRERLAAFNAATGMGLTLPSDEDLPHWISMKPFRLTELERIHGADDTLEGHWIALAIFTNCRTHVLPTGEIVTETYYDDHEGPTGPGPR